MGDWAHVREITGTRLLVSLHHSFYLSANIEVFDLTSQGKAKKVYSFEEFIGCK